MWRAATHARRAAALLHRLMKVPDRAFERALWYVTRDARRICRSGHKARPADLQETATVSDQIPAGGGADRKRETVLDRLGPEWEKAVRDLHSSGWQR